MRKMNKERKQCNKILSRRNAQGRKGQRSKTKVNQRQKRNRKKRKCTSKSRRQGRFGLGGFAWSSSWGTPLVGLGGLGLVSGLGLGLGTGLGLTGLGLGLGAGFIFQRVSILGHVSRFDKLVQLGNATWSWG